MSNPRKRQHEGVRLSKSDILSDLGLDVQIIIAEDTESVDVGNPKSTIDYAVTEAVELLSVYPAVAPEDIVYVTGKVNTLDQTSILQGVESERKISKLHGSNNLPIVSHIQLYKQLETIGLLDKLRYSEAVKGIIDYAKSNKTPFTSVVRDATVCPEELAGIIETQLGVSTVPVSENANLINSKYRDNPNKEKHKPEHDMNKMDRPNESPIYIN